MITECLPTSRLGGLSVVLVRVHPTLTGSLVGSCLLPRSTLDSMLSTWALSQIRSPHVRLWAELHDLCRVPHHGASLPSERYQKNCDLSSLPPWLQKSFAIKMGLFCLSVWCLSYK